MPKPSRLRRAQKRAERTERRRGLFRGSSKAAQRVTTLEDSHVESNRRILNDALVRSLFDPASVETEIKRTRERIRMHTEHILQFQKTRLRAPVVSARDALARQQRLLLELQRWTLEKQQKPAVYRNRVQKAAARFLREQMRGEREAEAVHGVPSSDLRFQFGRFLHTFSELSDREKVEALQDDLEQRLSMYLGFSKAEKTGAVRLRPTESVFIRRKIDGMGKWNAFIKQLPRMDAEERRRLVAYYRGKSQTPRDMDRS